MGQRAPRMCKRCHATALPGTSLCEKHKDSDAIADKARKAGNHLRTEFNYNCKAWRATRQLTLFRYPQCAHTEDFGPRCPQLATEAHHVINARLWVERGGNYLDQDNLVGLCRACHSRYTAAERNGTTVAGSFAPPDNEWSPVI
jgi:5-methylcytosine-specific restriction endonuclease McrA